MTNKQPPGPFPTCIYDVVCSSAPKPKGKREEYQRAPAASGGPVIPKISDMKHVPCIQTLAQATLQSISKCKKKSSDAKKAGDDDSSLSRSCHGPTTIPIHHHHIKDPSRRRDGLLRRSHSLGDEEKSRALLEDILKDFNWDGSSGDMRDSTSILTDYNEGLHPERRREILTKEEVETPNLTNSSRRDMSPTTTTSSSQKKKKSPVQGTKPLEDGSKRTDSRDESAVLEPTENGDLQQQGSAYGGDQESQRRRRKASKSPSNRRINRSPERGGGESNDRKHPGSSGEHKHKKKTNDGLRQSNHCRPSKRGSPSSRKKQHNNLRRAKSAGELQPGDKKQIKSARTQDVMTEASSRQPETYIARSSEKDGTGDPDRGSRSRRPVPFKRGELQRSKSMDHHKLGGGASGDGQGLTTKKTINRGRLQRSRSMDRHRLDLSTSRERRRLRRTDSGMDGSARTQKITNTTNTTSWRRNAPSKSPSPSGARSSRRRSPTSSASPSTSPSGRRKRNQEQPPPLVGMQTSDTTKPNTLKTGGATRAEQVGTDDSSGHHKKAMDSSSSGNHSNTVRARRGRRSPSPMRRSPSPKRSISTNAIITRSPSPVLLGVDNVSQLISDDAVVAQAPCSTNVLEDSAQSSDRPQMRTIGRSGRLFTRSQSGRRLGGQQLREILQQEQEAAERERLAAAVQAAAEKAAAEQQQEEAVEGDGTNDRRQDEGADGTEQANVAGTKDNKPAAGPIPQSLGALLDRLPIPTPLSYFTVVSDDTLESSDAHLGTESDGKTKKTAETTETD